MNKDYETKKGRWGFRRLINALGYSFAGFRHALRHEVAIREELIALAILVPVSAVLPVSNLEHLILVLTMMLVLLVEFINSSIESAVDRISTEHHPLSARRKTSGAPQSSLRCSCGGFRGS